MYQTQIEKIFSNLRIKFKLVGNEFHLFCPFHKQQKYNSANFFINRNSGKFLCQVPGCVGGGNFQKFLKLLDIDVSDKELKYIDILNIAERINSFFQESFNEQFDYDEEREISFRDFLPISKTHKPFLKYLKKRKLSYKVCRENKIMICNIGLYRNRVIFPIFKNGKMVSFGARSIEKNPERKILYPKGNKIAQFLYGYSGQKSVIIVESIIDCLYMKSLGYDQTISTFSCKISESQFEQLMDGGTREIIIMFDNDRAGIDGRDLIMKRYLRPYKLNHGYVILPSGKDPNDCSEDEIDKAVSNVRFFKIGTQPKLPQIHHVLNY